MILVWYLKLQSFWAVTLDYYHLPSTLLLCHPYKELPGFGPGQLFQHQLSCLHSFWWETKVERGKTEGKLFFFLHITFFLVICTKVIFCAYCICQNLTWLYQVMRKSCKYAQPKFYYYGKRIQWLFGDNQQFAIIYPFGVTKVPLSFFLYIKLLLLFCWRKPPNLLSSLFLLVLCSPLHTVHVCLGSCIS